jgi:hypothetical protein
MQGTTRRYRKSNEKAEDAERISQNGIRQQNITVARAYMHLTVTRYREAFEEGKRGGCSPSEARMTAENLYRTDVSLVELTLIEPRHWTWDLEQQNMWKKIPLHAAMEAREIAKNFNLGEDKVKKAQELYDRVNNSQPMRQHMPLPPPPPRTETLPIPPPPPGWKPPQI